ncbi:MAG: hypothetical protein IBJ10_00365 [Phycisphaerales bacterium]|nr:hypothetical protein [Phycisphaerales bacterium]
MLVHRGPKVFTIGLLSLLLSGCSLVGLILALLAMAWGGNDLEAMNDGRIDREGYSLTVAGRILGIVGLIFSCFSVLYWVFFIVLFATGAALAPRP